MYCDAYTTEINDQTVPIAWGTSQYPPKKAELIELGCDLPEEGSGQRPSPRFPRVYAAARSSAKRLSKPVRHIEPAIRIELKTRVGIPNKGRSASERWKRISLFDTGLLRPSGTFDDGEWREDDQTYRYLEGGRFLDLTEEVCQWAGDNKEMLEEAARAVLRFETDINQGFDWMRKARQIHQGKAISRQAYVEACEEVGAPKMSDQEIIDASYSMEYGEFSPPHYDAEKCVKMILAKKRYRQMEKKAKPMKELFRRRAQERERKRREEAPTCSYEGCQREATMDASLGKSCPQHYDDLSAI